MVDIFPFWKNFQTLGRWNQHVDSQLPSLHLHFALSQPIYHETTLPLYLIWCQAWRLSARHFYSGVMRIGDTFMIFVKWWIFFHFEKFPNFREMKPTCGLPITKFASTLCLKPTYISQGNITAVFLFNIKLDSYWLDIFTLVWWGLGILLWFMSSGGYFSILENFSKLWGDETNLLTLNYQVCIYTLL